VVERFFRRLKEFRRVATRDEKQAANFPGMAWLAAFVINSDVHTASRSGFPKPFSRLAFTARFPADAVGVGPQCRRLHSRHRMQEARLAGAKRASRNGPTATGGGGAVVAADPLIDTQV